MIYASVVRIVGRLTLMDVQVVSISQSVGISLNTVEAVMGIRM